MGGEARYDAVAEWYEREFTGDRPGELAQRLLGDGPGRLIDVGCGGGRHDVTFALLGWHVTGIDISAEQLRFARKRGIDVVRADAAALPFDDALFDAAVSIWTHNDVEDFAAVVREIARVLRPGGPFVYVGGHPCFVGPHALFARARGVPELHPGYRRAGRYAEGPGVTPEGLRAKVGAVHVPLDLFMQAFLAAGLALEHFEEASEDEYPFMLAMRWRR
jgi:SAM-dependent methyltransferase